ncbi:hypothetical protein ACFQ1I_08225 [Kitasatospora arboriphila]
MTRTADPAPPQQDRWGLVAVAGLLSFTALLDMNAVNLALPSVADGLGVAQSTAQWAALGYQLPLVALLLPAAGGWTGSGCGPPCTSPRAGTRWAAPRPRWLRRRAG